MDFSEKLLNLRKANNMTQEQLAEKLDVSRQSISKWESGQVTPDIEKIVAISAVFDVTTDYLLKATEIDDLSVKTAILEKQQKSIMDNAQRQQQILKCIMYSIAVYILFIAVYIIGHYYFKIWNPSVIFAEFLVATAIVICICTKIIGKKS